MYIKLNNHVSIFQERISSQFRHCIPPARLEASQPPHYAEQYGYQGHHQPRDQGGHRSGVCTGRGHQGGQR